MVAILFTESPAISKRKPPSQRPERAPDAISKAIAAAGETERSAKSSEASPSKAPGFGPEASRGGRNGGHISRSGPAASPSTKRPKQP